MAVDDVHTLDFLDPPPLLHTFDRGRPLSMAGRNAPYDRNAHVMVAVIMLL